MEKVNNIDNKYIIKSVENNFRILDLFAERGKALSVTDVCNNLDINSNKAYRLLKTMEKAGYIKQDSDTSLFELTLKPLKLSRVALNMVEIRKYAIPHLKTLYQELKKKVNINLAVWEQEEVLIISRFDCEKLPRTHSSIGKKLPPHATALGKVLLCEKAREEIEDFFTDKNFKKYTKNTISCLEDLLEELDKVKEDKIAWDKEEHIPDVYCIAAPIRNGKSEIIAGISLSAFEVHMSQKEMEKTVDVLKETAHRITHSLELVF